MEEKKYIINILLNDYQNVNEHWLLATEHKAKTINLSMTLFLALTGAHFQFKNNITFDIYCIASLCIFLFACMIYAQKNAEYWTACLYLETIEKIINKIMKKRIITYTSDYKDFLFERNKILSISPVRLLQVLRLIPGFYFIIYCLSKAFNFNKLFFWVILIFYIITISYMIYIRHYVKKKNLNYFKRKLDEMNIEIEE